MPSMWQLRPKRFDFLGAKIDAGKKKPRIGAGLLGQTESGSSICVYFWGAAGVGAGVVGAGALAGGEDGVVVMGLVVLGVVSVVRGPVASRDGRNIIMRATMTAAAIAIGSQDMLPSARRP